MIGENLLSRLREWMNTGLGRWTAITAAVVVLGVAALVFLRDSTGVRADAIRAKGRDVLFYCRACQATGQVHIAWDEKFPLECPQCHERQAVPGFRCGKCRRIIEVKSDLVYRCPYPDCRFLYDKRIIKDSRASPGPPVDVAPQPGVPP